MRLTGVLLGISLLVLAAGEANAKRACPTFNGPPRTAIDEHLVHFALNSDQVPDCEGTDYVLRDVVRLAKHEGGVVEIRAHADRLGSSEYNGRLSRRRGEAVKRALVQRGLLPEAIRVHALGETELPVITSDNVGEQLNRLVSIRVKPEHGP
jgi:OOP family OmpA-OmpF porin